MRGALFAGINLIGDGLATTPAVREWKLAHKDEPVWYWTGKQEASTILLKNPFIDRVKMDEDWDKVRSMRGMGDFTKRHLFDVGAAFSHGARTMHMAQAYGDLAGVQVTSCRPVLRITDAERAEAAKIIPLCKFIVVCPHSVSSTGLDTPNREGNKLWGDSRWRELFPIIHEMGYMIASLGGPKDPKLYPEDDSLLTEFHTLPVRIAAAVMERADYVVTIDSGLAHVAAALDKNLVELYPSGLPPEWVKPHVSHSRIIYDYPPDVKPKQVARELADLIGECEGKPKKEKKAEEVSDDPGDSQGIATPPPEARNDGEVKEIET